jgi:site-specific recombinase XerC
VRPCRCPLGTAAEYARAEKAEATRRAYRSDFELFRAWCAERHVSVLPASPESVAAFLAHEAERQVRPSTIGRRVAAIRYAHKLAGLPLPTDDERVRATMRGIRRSLGTARAKKTPATVERIVAMAPLAGGGLANIRDRALLLFGFASAMRRSELAALDFEDIEETAEGLRVTIRRSKTDQEGHGHVIAIPRGTNACPVAALKAWLQIANITAGPVFRPIAKGERVSAARLTDCHHRQGARRPCRARSGGLCRSFVALRIPDQRRGAGRLDIHDGRSIAPPEHGYAARVRPRRGDFQGSCGEGIAVICRRSHACNYGYNRGAVGELVGIDGGVVSGVINLESSGVEASDWRPRHDERYHEA